MGISRMKDELHAKLWQAQQRWFSLKDQGYKSIVVEGHTDGRGKASDNDTLSLKRAESVRTHLVSQGMPSDKIRATGIGASRPVADNNTADGRANNRRVELIVEPLGK